VRYLLGLDLTNVVCFKKLSVDFKEGLTYVRGLNLDSDPSNPTSNGSGKTLLFSALANVLFQTTPLARKKKSKKNILRGKNSAVGLILKQSDDAAEHEVIQYPNGYKIYEGGKDLKLRTIPLAEEYIRKLFPMSETMFYSTCFLSTQRPYALQRDTDSNRLQHITDIFSLDQYSGVRDIIAVRLRSIKDNELKLSVLEQHLVGLRKKISELSAPISAEEYEAIKREYATKHGQLEDIQAKIFKCSNEQRDLESLLKVERTLDKLRKKYSFKKKPAVMAKILKAQRAHAIAYDKWQHSYDKYMEQTAKIDLKLAAITLPDVDEALLKKKLQDAHASLDTLRAKVTEQEDFRRQHKKLTSSIDVARSEFDELGIPEAKINIDRDYAAELAVLNSTLRLEKLLERGDEKECPTCLSKLDLDAIATTVSTAKKKIPKLTSLCDAVGLLAKIEELESKLPEFDGLKLEALEKKVLKFEALVESCEDMLSTYKKHSSLVEQRLEIDEPSTPDFDKPKYTVDELDEYLELCNSIIGTLSSKDVILENHPSLIDLRSEASVAEALDKSISAEAALKDKQYALREKLSGISELILQYEQHQNTSMVYSKELEDVQLKIEKLSPQVSDKKLLEILMKAYGTKGLRATAANSVCQLLQTNLNHYRDLIFAEPFTFELHASDTGVSILVDRQNGKADSVSDVRDLSGAESNSFQLLCLISLLPLLPDKDRVNLVILDEPTSHQCNVSRAIFNERFLPVLRQVVPSIFVISPHSDDSSPNSSEWLVKKHGGLSTLIASN